MIKKLITGFALLATLSHASWDNLPIQEKGSIQVAGQISYMTMDPISGPMLAVGARFSPFSWLELSTIVPFGFFSIDGTHKGIDESNLIGIMNPQFGLKFQLSTGFSLYVDGYLPSSNDMGQDNFAVDFGLQHSNIFTSVIWAKYIGYMLGDAWNNQYFHFGTEVDVLFSNFTIYAALNIIKGEEASVSNCYGGTCSSDDVGGNNGVIFDIGAKFKLSDNVTLDASVEITGGDRYNIEGIDEPTIFNVTVFYNF